jgi:ring-1,2-phenylacetyl-CoA epoxidase subunit PaaC
VNTSMDLDQKTSLMNYCIALGDDSLMLGHRLSEWCSNGPFLEEDLALTNVALDFIGRARFFYSYAAELEGKGRNEDDIAYLRDCREYRNFLVNELPNGDFAFTMARQLMVDVYDMGFFTQLAQSQDPMLAAISVKAIKESRYHHRRSEEWIKRLGDGTEESHERTQTAFNQLWGYAAEMFHMSENEQQLVAVGIAVDRRELKQQWTTTMHAVLRQSTLDIPLDNWAIGGGRDGNHTEHLGYLLAELQFLQRSYPGQQW